MGSVSGDADDRTIDLFADGDLQAPSIDDGIVELTFKSSKQDGYPVWTESKSKLIQHYVRYFILITKHGMYIDGFAGPQSLKQLGSWSAALVLESKPKWLRKFILCEISRSGLKALKKLVESQSGARNKKGHKLLCPSVPSVVKLLLPCQRRRRIAP